MLKDITITRSNKHTAPLITAVRKQKGISYKVILHNLIDTPDTYGTLINILDSASENDDITIVINSPGGYVDSGLIITAAMDRCKAPITTVAAGLVASCGAGIFIHGDQLKVSRFSRIMIHASRGMVGGTMREIQMTSKIYESTMKEFIRTAVDKKILTEQEFTDVFENSQDVWLSCKELDEKGVMYTKV